MERWEEGEDLDFSVQLDGGPLVARGKAHAQLSAGARDQLYLAVRLAVSEFLSRGKEPVPLLLDDVFATSDDDRLRAGMRALIESFGAGHQVLVTTCHRGRMDELKRADPELYRERVHWVDLRAGIGVRQGHEQGRDSGAEAEPDDSGGQYFFISPGVSVSVTPQVQIFALAQLPIYQYVNGGQLTASWGATAGIGWRF